MIPKKIYLNYVDESDPDKTWSEEPVSVCDCKMKNREYTDLSQIWHDASEEPEDGYLLIEFGENKYDTMVLRYYFGESIWKIWCREKKITRWAYINDLLPKQFGNSEQLKGGEE